MRHVSEPALQGSPDATAAHYERIRDSVEGRKKALSAPHREGLSRGPLLTGIALVMILVAVGIATVMIVPRLTPPDRSTPQATITGYFNALKQTDSARAWQFVSASRNDTGSQASFTQNLHADDTRYGKVVSIQIVAVENDSTSHVSATVRVTRTSDTNNPVVYSISLSQYDGTTWLIDSVTSQ